VIAIVVGCRAAVYLTNIHPQNKRTTAVENPHCIVFVSSHGSEENENARRRMSAR